MTASDNAAGFNAHSSGFMDDFWLHALLIIPIEFGILHSTPLGPMLTEFFHGMWESMGVLGAATAEGAVEGSAGGLCHLHGTEMVCH